MMSEIPPGRSGLSAREVALGVVHQAGQLLMQHFHGDKKLRVKGRGNIVTDVDVLAENMIMDRLHAEFPDFAILTEESEGFQGDAGYTWIVDPLDGTRNYASGVPIFSVNLALARGEEVVLGFTYDPARSELFHGEKGKGAFLNETRLQVSSKTAVRWSLIGFDMGYHDERARNALRMVTALWPGMQSMRVMGSSALGLAYAAAGRLDIYVHHNLAPWDIASGILLVQEAGGTITDRHGKPLTYKSDSVIASNSEIHADFLHLTEGMDWRA